MNRCKLSFVILYLCVVTWPLVLLHAQKNPFLEQIRNFPQEKIHVTTDRDAYIAGDTVWLRAHCVDAATLEPLTARRYVYVELRTTDNLLVRRIKILQRGGVYAGYLPLPATLAQDEYVLCAYTLYMRNLGGDYLFSKPLSVNPYRQPEKRRRRTAAGPFDVAFFPESGYLIDGQPCRVGFKALGKDGLSRQVTGTVRDDRGRTVARFASRHAGMGSFEFTPRPGRRYTAECVQTSGGKSRRFDLPEANDFTFVLRVEPNDTSFVVSVRSAKKWRPQGLKLLVHRCGTQCYYKEWNPQHASLTFLRDELPGGLYQILLLSPTGEAYSERLVFNRRDEETEVTMRQEGTLQQRSKVTLHFEVHDTKRRPAQGDFAVAVTDRKAAAPVATAGIYSTLMLSSELRGVIEDPDWYFAPDNAQGDEGLDELLLTQGWRRYDVPKLLFDEGLDAYVVRELGLPFHDVDWAEWADLLERVHHPKHEVNIAIVGKYIDLPDAYLSVTEAIKAGGFAFPESRRFVVAGFNALSECEKRLFKFLSTAAETDFYWDYDTYYTDNADQEAGMFLRENRILFPARRELPHDHFRSPKRIEAISTVSNAVQCKYVASILRELAAEQGPLGKETAVVLTDENLLLPLLHALPAEIGKVNVTMGYPLKQSLSYSFVERLIELQNHAWQKEGKPLFYHADVLGLLSHP